MPSPETSSLLPRLRAHFNLSQPELGHCLGLSRTMVSQVERGLRPLPLPASLPQAALTLAYHNTPAAPEPEALDADALQKQQRACLHRAGQLGYELGQLPVRAAWARKRLAALPPSRPRWFQWAQRPQGGSPNLRPTPAPSYCAAAAPPRPGCGPDRQPWKRKRPS